MTDFDFLEIAKNAPDAGGMTVVEYTLLPTNFPYGQWSARIGDSTARLELQKGPEASLLGTLFIVENNPKTDHGIQLRGRFKPMNNLLTLNEVGGSGSRATLQAILADLNKTMTGKW